MWFDPEEYVKIWETSLWNILKQFWDPRRNVQRSNPNTSAGKGLLKVLGVFSKFYKQIPTSEMTQKSTVPAGAWNGGE